MLLLVESGRLRWLSLLEKVVAMMSGMQQRHKKRKQEKD